MEVTVQCQSAPGTSLRLTITFACRSVLILVHSSTRQLTLSYSLGTRNKRLQDEDVENVAFGWIWVPPLHSWAAPIRNVNGFRQRREGDLSVDQDCGATFRETFLQIARFVPPVSQDSPFEDAHWLFVGMGSIDNVT